MTELRDFRVRITPEADSMLEALSRASGRDKQEIAREVLHVWAGEKLREHQMVSRFFRGTKGTAGEGEGGA